MIGCVFMGALWYLLEVDLKGSQKEPHNLGGSSGHARPLVAETVAALPEERQSYPPGTVWPWYVLRRYVDPILSFTPQRPIPRAWNSRSHSGLANLRAKMAFKFCIRSFADGFVCMFLERTSEQLRFSHGPTGSKRPVQGFPFHLQNHAGDSQRDTVQLQGTELLAACCLPAEGESPTWNPKGGPWLGSRSSGSGVTPPCFQSCLLNSFLKMDSVLGCPVSGPDTIGSLSTGNSQRKARGGLPPPSSLPPSLPPFFRTFFLSFFLSLSLSLAFSLSAGLFSGILFSVFCGGSPTKTGFPCSKCESASFCRVLAVFLQAGWLHTLGVCQISGFSPPTTFAISFGFPSKPSSHTPISSKNSPKSTTHSKHNTRPARGCQKEREREGENNHNTPISKRRVSFLRGSRAASCLGSS